MIAKLIYNCPPDLKTETGQLFWSGPHRLPQILNFDPEDPVSLSFLVSASNIFAYTLGLDYCHDKDLIKKISKSVVLPVFEVKKIKVMDTKDKSNEPEVNLEEDEEFIQKIEQRLRSNII